MFLIFIALPYHKGELHVIALFFALLDVIVSIVKHGRELLARINSCLYFRMGLVIVFNERLRTGFNGLVCLIDGILNFRTHFRIILLK